MTGWNEIIAILGTAVVSAFALVRMALRQHEVMFERFLRAMDSTVKRQESASLRHAEVVAVLSEGVRENTQLLRRIADGLAIQFHDRRQK